MCRRIVEQRRSRHPSTHPSKLRKLAFLCGRTAFIFASRVAALRLHENPRRSPSGSDAREHPPQPTVRLREPDSVDRRLVTCRSASSAMSATDDTSPRRRRSDAMCSTIGARRPAVWAVPNDNPDAEPKSVTLHQTKR
jgi:hypothetical protein